MLTIHKYDLIKDAGRIEIPAEAEILSIQLQNGKPFLWAKVDTDFYLSDRRFVCYGTGWELLENSTQESEIFIATVQDNIGLVWHWFEVV
jgi:hypothetical protein